MDILRKLFRKKECRCSQLTRPICSVGTSSFFYKVLVSLHSFQENPLLCDGAKISDIIDHVQNTYPVDGDIKSQVKTALAKAVSLGLIWKKPCGTYQIVINSAAIQNTLPNSKKRIRKFYALRRIFIRSEKLNESFKSNCSSSSASSSKSKISNASFRTDKTLEDEAKCEETEEKVCANKNLDELGSPLKRKHSETDDDKSQYIKTDLN